MMRKHVRRILLGGAILAVPLAGCSASVDKSVTPDILLESLSETALFEAPVQIKAGDEFVSVESPGYACPTMADVDGDGLEDLVVGQFSQGHMQFCKNIADAGEPPEFATPQWLKTGDKRAVVPGVW